MSADIAVLLDLNGAAFGTIPVVASQAIKSTHDGASSDSVGRISWLDLTVSDASSTRNFYLDVVGWSVQGIGMDDAGERYTDYALCMADGTAVAGVCHARGVNQAIPPVWLICVTVGDLAESLGRVRELGGEVVEERRGTSGGYVYAVIREPVGACRALAPG